MDARPTAATVARRALCAAALFTRGFIERNIQLEGQSRELWDQEARHLGSWLAQCQLLPQATSAREVRLIGEPLGSWSRRDIADVGWRSESIGVLLWALEQRHSLPPYDRPLDPTELEGALPVLGDASGFVARVSLRGQAELDRERDVAELWSWRARIAVARRGGNGSSAPPSPVVTEAATSAHQAGLIPAPIAQDFPAYGRPFRDLSVDQLAEVAAIATERQLALNWLTGCALSWDEIPVSG